MRTNDAGIAERVRTYVAHETGVAKQEIGPHTTLARDLALDGALGLMFITGFARAFGVDLAGFDADRHFPNPPGVWARAKRLLGGRAPAGPPDTAIPITVRDLTLAAERGAWHLPATHGRRPECATPVAACRQPGDERGRG